MADLCNANICVVALIRIMFIGSKYLTGTRMRKFNQVSFPKKTIV
jgi:hypothetical protein